MDGEKSWRWMERKLDGCCWLQLICKLHYPGSWRVLKVLAALTVTVSYTALIPVSGKMLHTGNDAPWLHKCCGPTMLYPLQLKPNLSEPGVSCACS